jgi:WD40 repeat protein
MCPPAPHRAAAALLVPLAWLAFAPAQPPCPAAAPPAPAARSPLDRLDPRRIAPADRPAGWPGDVVAVLGSSSGRHAGSITCLAYSPDGRWIASGGTDAVVRIQEAATLRCLAELGDCQGVGLLAFSPDGKRLAVGGLDLAKARSWLQLWEIRADALTPGAGVERQESVPGALAFSADAGKLAVAKNLPKEMRGGLRGRKPTVQVLDASGAAPREIFEVEVGGEYIFSLALSPDGRRLAAGTEAGVRLWDLEDASQSLSGPDKALLGASGVLALALSIGAPVLLVAFGWRRLRATLRGAASGGGPGSSLADHPWLRRRGAKVWAVGLFLLIVGLVVLRLREEAGPPWRIPLGASVGRCTAVALSADGALLAAAGPGNDVVLWDLSGERPRVKARLAGHTAEVRSLAFAPDGRALASADTQTTRVWDLRGDTPRERAALPGRIAAFSPDGRGLVTGDDSLLRVWDLSQDEPREQARDRAKPLVVASMAFGADGRTLVLGCADRTVRLWDLGAEAPRERRVIEGLASVAWDVSLSPDGKQLVVIDEPESVRLWNLGGAAPKERAVLLEAVVRQTDALGIPFSLWRRTATFFPDGQVLLVNDGARPRLWDVGGPAPREWALPKEFADFRGGGRAPPVVGTWAVFAPDGRTLALGGPGRPGVQLWDLSGGQLKLRAVLGARNSAGLGFSPDGRALASLHTIFAPPRHIDQLFVDWWDIDQRAIKSQVLLEPQNLSGRLLFVPLGPGARAVSWLDGAISAPPAGRARIWSTLTGEYRECKPSCGSRRRSRSDPAPALPAFAPDGRHMAVSYDDGAVHIVRLPAGGEGRDSPSWCDRALRQNPRDVEALLQRAWLALGGDRPDHPGPHPGSLVRCLRGHPEEGAGAAFLPGRRVATAGPDGTLSIWDLETVLPVRTLRGKPSKASKARPRVVASKDGRRLLVAEGPRLHLWDLDNGKEIEPPQAHREAIVEALFSDDGGLALSASGDGTVHLRDAASGKHIGAFQLKGGPITCVALAPGGRLGASAGLDGAVRLWDAATGEGVRVLKGHTGPVRRLAFVGDDRLLSAGANGTFRRWDVAQDKEVGSRRGPSQKVESAALSSRGGLALCRSADATLAVYDTATGERMRVLQAQSRSDFRAGSEQLAVSADGLLALAAGANGVRVWRMPPTLDQVEVDLHAALGVEKSARAYYLRGLLRARRQARAGAIADFTEAIRLDPKHARAYHARGILLAEQEDYARAREDLDRAFDLEPALANVGGR